MDPGSVEFDLLEQLFFHSTKSKRKNDMVSVLECIRGSADTHRGSTDIFPRPTILMSDLHNNTQQVIDYLTDRYDLAKYVVITVGDMSGNDKAGGDGVSTGFYQQLRDKSEAFYYVQGNHDLPDDQKECDSMKNYDGSLCMVHRQTIHLDKVGKIGGVNGIISNKVHPYKMAEKAYLTHLKTYKGKLDVLLLHDTPKHSPNVVGREDIWHTIKTLNVPIVVYGHCHHTKPYYYTNRIHLFNVDARIIIFQ